MPQFKGPGEIIDSNEKVKINNKFKVLNVNKLKLFLQENNSEIDTQLQDLNFNDYSSDKPLTRTCAKLINYKIAALLALSMLGEEVGEEYSDIEGEIDSLCDGPCASCDSEEDYFKLNPPKRNFTQKCQNCENYKKLFLKLKEREKQCYQLRQQIKFACQHRLHQKYNQIKSVDTKLKTGIAESLHEPLMKIAQKLLMSDKKTFEQLTTLEQNLWTRFETGDIYRFLTGEKDTVLEFQYNWTSIPRLPPLGPTATPIPAPTPTTPVAPQAPPPAPVTPPDTSSSDSSSSSSPHSSPTLSTSGTQPKQRQDTTTKPNALDPSGASTSGTTPPTTISQKQNLRLRTKVDYKDLNTGASQFGRDQFRKRCSQAGASVRKSVAKIRKMSLADLFPPISRNSSSSSTASSK